MSELTKEVKDDIFGGKFNFVKADDLIGHRFLINDYEMTMVEGFDAAAMKISITLEGKETNWTSFSVIVHDQVKKLKEAGALPFECSLETVKSKTNKGRTITRLVE